MNIERSGFTTAAVIIGLSLIAGTGIVAYNFYKVKALSDVITVTGAAQKNITSDVVKWRSSFSRNVSASNLREGYSQMKSDLEMVAKFLKDNGVQDADITVSPISVMQNYNNAYGKPYGPEGSSISGYTLTQSILIESGEVEKITKIAQDSGTLINQGVIFSSNNPEYYYSKLSDIKVEMLAEGTKDAMARARKIAESANSKLGHLKSASMGVIQITSVNSTDISDYGYYDTSSIEKQITAIVKTSFTLK
jgi:hypothetical protein